MFHNSRKQGDAGLGQAIAWFTKNGYTVSVPLTDSQDYDLVVDNGSGLKRVQVKTTTRRTRYGVSHVDLRVNGGNRSGSGKEKKFSETMADYIFAVVVGDEWEFYLIPTLGLGNHRTSISLGKTSEGFKVKI